MNILFLDDNELRHEAFRSLPLSFDTVIHSYSYEEAVNALKQVDFNILFLDHDLSEEDIMCTPGIDNRGKTGTDLARWIVTAPIKRPDLVILHTFNPVGAKTMKYIFTGVGIPTIELPFNINDFKKALRC